MFCYNNSKRMKIYLGKKSVKLLLVLSIYLIEMVVIFQFQDV